MLQTMLQRYIKRLPRELQDALVSIRDIARRLGMPVYLVGGVVRDMMLGVDNFDLDIVVVGDAIQLAGEFACKSGARLITHKQFGTATVVVRHGGKIDFATSRKETYPCPADLPVVCRGVLPEDLARRDFSINAMALDLNRERFGALIDCFEGTKDLRSGKIRVLHDASFRDDPTRMLRAIRFEQRYGFSIEPHTLSLLIEAAGSGMLEKVEPQRVRDEFMLILKEDDPLKPIRRIRELIGFGFIDRGFALSRKTLALLESSKKQIGTFTKKHITRRRLDVWVIYLIALFDSLRSAKAEKVCKKFAFHRGERKRILDYKKINNAYVRGLSRKRIKASRIFRLLEPLSYEVIIVLKAKNKNHNFQHNIEEFLTHYNGTRIHVDGDELRELGIEPGPGYQKIFSKVLNARLDGLLKTREEELAFIKKMIQEK